MLGFARVCSCSGLLVLRFARAQVCSGLSCSGPLCAFPPPGRWCVVRPSADWPRRAGVSYTWDDATTGNPDHIAIYANMPREQFERLPLVFSQKELLVWEALAARRKAVPTVSAPIPPMSDSPSPQSQPEPIRLWVNVYPHNRISDVYHTSDGADLQAEPDRIRRVELREWRPDTGEALEKLKHAPLYQPHEHSLDRVSFQLLVLQWTEHANREHGVQTIPGPWFELPTDDPRTSEVQLEGIKAWATAWFKDRGYTIQFEAGPWPHRPHQFYIQLVNEHEPRQPKQPEQVTAVPDQQPHEPERLGLYQKYLWKVMKLRHGHLEYASVSTDANAYSWVFSQRSVAKDLVKLHREHLHCHWEVQNILSLLPLSASPHARVKVLVTSEPNPKVLMHVADDRLAQEIKQAHNQVVDLIRQGKANAEGVPAQKG